MIYCFDIDGTITETQGNDYEGALPNQLMIDKINSLFEEGHRIIFLPPEGALRVLIGQSLRKNN